MTEDFKALEFTTHNSTEAPVNSVYKNCTGSSQTKAQDGEREVDTNLTLNQGAFLWLRAGTGENSCLQLSDTGYYQ